MPKRYKLKFGGSEGVSQSMNTTPLILGIILLCICVPIFSLLGYYGYFVDKCQDKDKNDELIHAELCDAGQQLKNSMCDGDCDKSTCCEEYNCKPPTTLQRGYKVVGGGVELLSTSTFKSLSGFQGGSRDLDNVTCDTPNYEGDAKAVSCAGRSDKKWRLTGCDVASSGGRPACVDGVNSGNRGTPGTMPRTLGTCNTADISHTDIDDTENKRKCDSIYESEGRFCYFKPGVIDECVVYSQDEGRCSLPSS